MIGRDWRVPIGLVLALNSSLGRNRAFALITLVSIAVSVTLATGLEISSRAVQERASTTADAMAGSAALEIVGGTLGVSESLVEAVAEVPGVAVASPVIDAVLHTTDQTLPIHVIGIDLVSGSSVRAFSATANGVRINDPLRLLARADSIVVSADLAKRLGADLGTTVTLRSHLGPADLRIEGILAEGGLASAFGSQVAVMDVFALQALLGRLGSIDRIDIVPRPGASIAALQVEVEKAIQGAATVRPVGLRRSLADSVLNAVRRVVLIIAAIGALAAGLVSYTAMSASVERRLAEFSLLRSTGMAASAIRTWILVDASIASAAGMGLGCMAGTILGRRLVPVMLTTTDYLAESSVDPESVGFGLTTLGVAFAVGGFATLLGTAVPARMATRRWAFDRGSGSGDSSSRTPTALRWSVAGWVIGIFAVAAAGALGSPAFRLVCWLVLGTSVAWLIARHATERVDAIHPLLGRLIPSIGHLIGSGLQFRARSTALSVSTIAALFAFVVAIITLSSSFSETIVRVVNTRFTDGLVITAGPLLEGPGRERLSAETIAAISAAPEIVELSPAYNETVLYQGEEIDVVGITTRVAIERRNVDLVDGEPHDVLTRLESGDVVVSDAFARRFDLGRGGSVRLKTPKGELDFRIAGVARALAGPAGLIYTDIRTIERVWGRSGATSVVVWASGSPEAAVDAIVSRVQGKQSLFFLFGDNLRRHALKFAGRFDSMIVAIATLAALLSAIAVANLFVGLVAARRLEFALLRVAGAGPMHLSALIMCDALLVAIGGVVLGVPLGILISFPVLELLQDDFGLAVNWSTDVGALAVLVSTLVLAAMITALYPAAVVHRPVVTEAIPID